MVKLSEIDNSTYHIRNHETVIITSKEVEDGLFVTVNLPYSGAYGMGEHFHCVNYKGKTIRHLVKEVFCNQDENTYLSIPFFVTDTGFGMYIDSDESFDIVFGDNITFNVSKTTKAEVFIGNPIEVIGKFNKMIGKIPLLDTQYLGPWISANHWNTEEKTLMAAKQAKELGFPVSVLVLEAWSDEATFYIFNGAKYKVREDGSAYKYEDFDFSDSEYWHDPKAMISKLKEDGIAVVLWQIPVYKKLSADEPQNRQNTVDEETAIRERLCVEKIDGTPYRIPEGNWFGGSLVPDFSNPKTRQDWFAKRQYLLDIGVSGFKTDGGEFIYQDDLRFFDKKSGKEKKNTYCQDYIGAYTKFIGDGRLLFSRAGSTGIAQTPAIWAGDHQSTNDELKNVFNAAMSSASSGILYWSFDIGGFAGPMPSLDLYRRATQFAVFTPIMQWHSEPDGGQFKEIMPGAEGNNERSPWNIAALYESPEFIDEMRFYHNLRMEFVPYISNQCKKCVDEGIPLMRPLYLYCYDCDEKYLETEYFFGEDYIIAPLLEENETFRDVYLPAGKYRGYFSKEYYDGESIISSVKEKYPVFELIKE